MGFFSRIIDKIRGHASGSSTQAQAPSGGQQEQFSPPGGQQQSSPAGATRGGAAGAPSSQALQNVDVDAVLRDLAAKKGGGGNYRESIVDLLKLLDLDSSLSARKELAQELGVNAGEHGSAEQNIALHKAVMRKLAENGGKVPDSLRD